MCLGPTDEALSSFFRGMSLYLLYFLGISESDLDTTTLEFWDFDELDMFGGFDTDTYSDDFRVWP